MRDFAGKTAVIIGSATGIGQALAKESASHGMKLALVDVDERKLEDLAACLRDEGHEVFTQVADVSSLEQLGLAADNIFAHFDTVDVLFNNAGIQRMENFLDIPIQDHIRTLEVCLNGVLYGFHCFLPRMLAAGRPGHIVSTGSSSSISAPPGLSSYNAAKHGIWGFSESLYHELKAGGAPIGVSIVCPGAVKTDIFDWNRYGKKAEGGSSPQGETIKMFIDQIGITPEEVASCVFEGIRKEQFMIHTHGNETKNLLNQRIEKILEDRPPEWVFPELPG